MSEGTAQKVGIVLQGPSPVPPPPRYFTLRTRFKYIPAGATATVAAGAREGGGRVTGSLKCNGIHGGDGNATCARISRAARRRWRGGYIIRHGGAVKSRASCSLII